MLELIDSYDSSMIQAEESVYNQELHRKLTEVLLRLPKAEREVLTLRYFFGISYIGIEMWRALRAAREPP